MKIDINKFLQSKLFKVICWVIAGLIILLIGLKAGMFIGFRKANFSFKWGENYHKNFGGPRGGFFGNFEGRDFIEGQGDFGQIIKIDGNAPTSTPASALSLVIKGRGDVEKIVLVKNDAVIKRFKTNIKPTDLKVDDYIVVIGEPNDHGQIEAKLIRLSPLPMAPPSSRLPLPRH